MKTYLGDGVYAEHDGWNVWIWTNNGETESPHICIEPEVYDALALFAKRGWDLAREQRERAARDA